MWGVADFNPICRQKGERRHVVYIRFFFQFFGSYHKRVFSVFS